MGLPYPVRLRPPHYYYPYFAVFLIIGSIIGSSIWIHYTTDMIHNLVAFLQVMGGYVEADNKAVLEQSVVATSVLYIIYAAVMFGLILWRSMLEAEMDSIGQVKDKLQLFQMANLGVRICWWFIMTWMVVLLAGCAIFSIYISNIKFTLEATLGNQANYPTPVVPGTYPDCPATCVDLWVINYIDVPKEDSCICNKDTLTSGLALLADAEAAVPGCLVGVFMMYILGGHWRAELSKIYASVRKEQDVAARLAGEAPGLEGRPSKASSAGGGKPGASGGSGSYSRLPGAPGMGSGRGGTGVGRGRGRGRGSGV